MRRVGVEPPLEHGAWDVKRAGDDPDAGAFVPGTEVDDQRAGPLRLERLLGFETFERASSAFEELLDRGAFHLSRLCADRAVSSRVTPRVTAPGGRPAAE